MACSLAVDTQGLVGGERAEAVSPPSTSAEAGSRDASTVPDSQKVDDSVVTLPGCTVAGPGISTCGANADENCCTSPLVEGGSFRRAYDGVTFTISSFPATTSRVRLDRFETTVGRFRRFVGAVASGWLPRTSSGKHDHLNGGRGLAVATSFEGGWSATWEATLERTRTEWSARLACAGASWTPSVGANETHPIGCVSWFEAYAFCIWDGGFLPTQAEWNAAAAGGSEQRVYPWSNPVESSWIDCSFANFGGANWPETACHPAGASRVGTTSPKGDGRWGHADLAGNVAEWALDWQTGAYPMPCVDCASVTDGTARLFQGGARSASALGVLASASAGLAPAKRDPEVGFRCARSP